ncbi:hypothetical protein P154DRAFT_573245 [Amniculicola lignicola CBS 123094]|uniref:Uncharacterized protein n=1 Tax=Amniculicola lignicola CBS 123094 TaxID=1392246 RepID=A0A6A5WR42_9PLEO|nr:hypothetical protein P154DRAFT_573245 [Amniculicola lignicola CBS 123094]
MSLLTNDAHHIVLHKELILSQLGAAYREHMVKCGVDESEIDVVFSRPNHQWVASATVYFGKDAYYLVESESKGSPRNAVEDLWDCVISPYWDKRQYLIQGREAFYE